MQKLWQDPDNRTSAGNLIIQPLHSVVSVQADSLVFQGLVDWEFQGLVGLAVLELVDLVGFLVLVDFLGR